METEKKQVETATVTKDMLGRKPLHGVEEALATLLSQLNTQLSTEHIQLSDALDRITAKDIFSPENLPAHPRSTMDGFAVCAADTYGSSESMPCYLQITGEVLMGQEANGNVTRGNCHRIATGGMVPHGADAVVMFEHTVPVDDTMIEIVKSVGSGANIIQTGDDIKEKSLAIGRGTKLRSHDLGLLAGIGITTVEVYAKVRLGIISTGDEIVDIFTQPSAGQVRNINSITIAREATKEGAIVTDYGIVEDSEAPFFSAISRGVEENDIVVFSGGSSVGTKDLGERAIENLGSPGILVHGVALKPGKPILIGLHHNTPIFGLPGHPVSAMVCFDLFVKLALRKISGQEQEQFTPTITAILRRNINSAAGRRDIVRVALNEVDGVVHAEPILGKSGSISTLSRAQGFLVVPEATQGLAEKSTVEVYLYT